MLYRPGCCRPGKGSRTRGRPKGPSGADHHGRGGEKGPPEPQVLIAPVAVAGGGPFQRRFAGLPHGGKSRKVHRLEMRKITKYFPGVKALSDVDFRLMKGEVQCSPDLQVHA